MKVFAITHDNGIKADGEKPPRLMPGFGIENEHFT